jgi:hypothetical protein
MKKIFGQKYFRSKNIWSKKKQMFGQLTMFVSLPEWSSYRLHFLGRLLALPGNITRGWWCLTATNTGVYYDAELVTSVENCAKSL